MASKARELRLKLIAKKKEKEEMLKKEEEEEKKNLLNNNNNNKIKPESKIHLKEISISSSSDDENENEKKNESNENKKNDDSKKNSNNNNNNIIIVPEEENDPLKYFDVNHINIDIKNPIDEISNELKKINKNTKKAIEKENKISNSDVEEKNNENEDSNKSSKLPLINKRKKKLIKMKTIHLLDDDNNDNISKNITKYSNHRTSISFGNMKLSILDLMEAKDGLKTNKEVEKTLESLRESERIKEQEEKKREKEREEKKMNYLKLIENINSNDIDNNNDELKEIDEKKKKIFIEKVNNENLKKTQERIKQLENFSSEEIQKKIDEIKELNGFNDYERIKNILLKSELPEFLFKDDNDIKIIEENKEIEIPQKIKIDIIQLYNNK